MTENTFLETTTVSIPAVKQSARQFAKTLAETPVFQAFEQAYIDFRQDEKAQSIYQELSAKQASLQAMIMLNAISDEDQQILMSLQERFNQCESVKIYSMAQQALMAECQVIGDTLSANIGLNFSSVCRTGGCCG